MIYQTPRQFGKTISQKAYIISNKLSTQYPITLLEAWDFILEYWRDNYGKELTYELVEEEYMKRKIMNRVDMGSLNLNLDREKLEKFERKEDEK